MARGGKGLLKFHPGPSCLTLLPIAAVSGVASPQSGPSLVVFYPFVYHTPMQVIQAH
jgi:hypothetical protein